MVVVALRLPEDPVIVTVTVPVTAVGLAVRVSVLIDVAVLGLKKAVTPFGSPEAASVTSPENPLIGKMVMVAVPSAPSAMVTVAGEAWRLKLPRVFTVRLSVVVFVSAPDVPVIVTVTAPVAAVALAVKVTVLLLVAGLEPNVAVTPWGKPDAERVTVPVKPCSGVMVIALVP